ncbi:MAG: 30S ribosomal protein S16 [Elusimicrobia bacterium]|nr:30S ribosomal protein S16 [Elusimicrobiota bacterium]
MATKIRLVRIGKRNRPFFRIVAVSKEKDGRGDVLEILGHYDPLPKELTLEVKEDRLQYWFGVGAKPSPTVKSILKKKGVLIPPNVDK